MTKELTHSEFSKLGAQALKKNIGTNQEAVTAYYKELGRKSAAARKKKYGKKFMDIPTKARLEKQKSNKESADPASV